MFVLLWLLFLSLLRGSLESLFLSEWKCPSCLLPEGAAGQLIPSGPFSSSSTHPPTQPPLVTGSLFLPPSISHVIAPLFPPDKTAPLWSLSHCLSVSLSPSCPLSSPHPFSLGWIEIVNSRFLDLEAKAESGRARSQTEQRRRPLYWGN